MFQDPNFYVYENLLSYLDLDQHWQNSNKQQSYW